MELNPTSSNTCPEISPFPYTIFSGGPHFNKKRVEVIAYGQIFDLLERIDGL
jgi:hypothetical protein